MSLTTSTPTFTLPSIHQLLTNTESNNRLPLPFNFNSNVQHHQTPIQSIPKPIPVQKSYKMKQNFGISPKYAVDKFDMKTFVKIQTENSEELNAEKPKWIFETGIFQKRGRKGKAKEWQLNIAKISNKNNV